MNQQGRSMVEMLGVLAIIGVLSVGAIAGYSKAMMKYKLNKQAEQITTLINGATLAVRGQQYKRQNTSGYLYLHNLMAVLNLIPSEMDVKKDKLRDAMGYDVGVHWESADWPEIKDFLVVALRRGNKFIEEPVCWNLLKTAKELSPFLITAQLYVKNRYINFRGDNYCSPGSLPSLGSGYPCLYALNMSQIQEFCSLIQEQESFFRFLWTNNR